MAAVLTKHNKKALERVVSRRGAVRMRQVNQLDYIADEAMQAWERSKGDATVVKVTEEGVGDTKVETKVETTTKEQVGDSSYLSEARAALAEIRKVLKITEAKSTTKHVGKNNGPIQIEAVRGEAESDLGQWQMAMRDRLHMMLELSGSEEESEALEESPSPNGPTSDLSHGQPPTSMTD